MDIRIVIPGLPIATPDPFAVEPGRLRDCRSAARPRPLPARGMQVTVFCEVPRPTRWQGVRLVPVLVLRRDSPPPALATCC